MNIVLHEPEIPQNTGNIARTCACTGASLHLIEPLGFSLAERHLKRAGLDYWDALDLHVYESYEHFLEANPGARLFFATTKAPSVYTEKQYGPNDFIVFGKESAGIPEEILSHHKNDCIRIPMGENFRSLNLSNAVAIVLYEALRQQNFAGLEKEGHLHHSTYIE
jgi:tRNA (cytidine/uridine-2'-O-)-methyltransferase